MSVHHIRTGKLDVAYERSGDPSGWPVVLLHGFPYDPRCYDDVAVRLSDAGADVIVPYLRGYGPTSFVDAALPRSGQQAALGHDLADLIDALELAAPIVAGYDWGGRAACVVSALWPEKVSGLVTVDGYNVQNIAKSSEPAPPASESGYWYQYYFHSERGRNGLAANRRELGRLLWTQWSPRWTFTDEQFAATAPAFDNDDFVDVVIQSYRHRYGLAPGDPDYDASEARLAEQPRITVPTIVLDPQYDGLGPPSTSDEHREHFTHLVEHRLVPTGHNAPQEDPAGFAAALIDLHATVTN